MLIIKYQESNLIKLKGKEMLFFTSLRGVASSEVKVHRDTGEVKVLATDILMDLGRPINEAMDIGQVSGAFIQGMGWMTTENLFYNDKGSLVSHAPSTYKIPNVQDMPRHYRIELLENEENYANVRGTKAVGEPYYCWPLVFGRPFKMLLPTLEEPSHK